MAGLSGLPCTKERVRRHHLFVTLQSAPQAGHRDADHTRSSSLSMGRCGFCSQLDLVEMLPTCTLRALSRCIVRRTTNSEGGIGYLGWRSPWRLRRPGMLGGMLWTRDGRLCHSARILATILHPQGFMVYRQGLVTQCSKRYMAPRTPLPSGARGGFHASAGGALLSFFRGGRTCLVRWKHDGCLHIENSPRTAAKSH